ncbi:terminase small subunit [Limosilactobacillus fermentum]|uniref:terminase small subunit n=1 Tax=Limosilactobacillus fermentum TaxID=1613 RepID=UPI000FECB185|nr:terminase small subunit [Limosilactobacillus fermentum]QAR22382.1 terminase small subunit [Limosilactobacillus fermentum]
MKLTAKQRLFADEYIKSGNATQSAIKAGYSPKTVRSIGQENLTKPDIKAYIDAKMAEIESHKIADAKEVLQYLTRVLRGEETEEIPDNVNGGTIKRPPLIKDRTVAAREIMKRYPLDDPMIAAQLKKLQAEADTAVWKRDALTGKNDTGDKTVLIDDIGGNDNGGD